MCQGTPVLVRSMQDVHCHQIIIFIIFAVKTKTITEMKKNLLALTVLSTVLSAFVMIGCEKEDKDAISMDTVNKGVLMKPGKDGKEYAVVDLGLNTKTLWATCNIGATSPEQTGYFIAWAETEAKDSYSWTTYKFCNGSHLTLNRYTLDKEHADNKTIDSTKIILPEDDAAKQIMGDNWRVPSRREYVELINSCDAKCCKLNGVWGYLFTSKKNGNSIFLPLSGLSDMTDILHKGTYGFYWSNELYSTTDAYILNLARNTNPVCTKFQERDMGLSIRPITK